MEGPHRHVPELARVRAYPAHSLVARAVPAFGGYLKTVGRMAPPLPARAADGAMRPLHVRTAVPATEKGGRRPRTPARAVGAPLHTPITLSAITYHGPERLAMAAWADCEKGNTMLTSPTTRSKPAPP